ncbi:MAG: hypothetical protein JO132_09420 [Streptosporangiaceae bacterium]|nr:hypothetical protein [Streptosporangiaceae bacterium]
MIGLSTLAAWASVPFAELAIGAGVPMTEVTGAVVETADAAADVTALVGEALVAEGGGTAEAAVEMA